MVERRSPAYALWATRTAVVAGSEPVVGHVPCIMVFNRYVR